MNLATSVRLDAIRSVRASQSKVIPASAVTATADAAGNFAKGAYAEISAAVTERSLPVAINVESVSAADVFEIELATGSAGSESTICTVRVTGAGRQLLGSSLPVENGERLAVRIGCKGSVARTADISVEYINYQG